MSANVPKKGKATCKLCPKVFTFNGSTPTIYIRSAHDKIMAESTPVGGRGVSFQVPGNTLSAAESKGLLGYFTKAKCSNERTSQISQLLADWCIRNVRPMSIVEDTGLRDVFRFVEPGFVVLSCTHLTYLVKLKYVIMMERTKDLLCSPSCQALSCTTDIWTSEATGYISLTAHFLDQNGHGYRAAWVQ